MKLPANATAVLTEDLPKNRWGKLLGATPIIMTVIATLMAGLSNGEMTRAQYERSLAAQQQSKVGDQWSFFQAKRQRGASLVATLRSLQATTDIGVLDGNALNQLGAATIPSTNLTRAVNLLTGAESSTFKPRPIENEAIKAALESAAAGEPDEQVLKSLGKVSSKDLQAVIRGVQEESRAFDVLTAPAAGAVDKLENLLMAQTTKARESVRSLMRDFTAARMRYDAARYDAEAKFNRTLAELMELQVRQSNATAEHHRIRSQRFFVGMLGAQMAVILASFALALQQRRWIWTMAACIGLAALGFGIYVYLWM